MKDVFKFLGLLLMLSVAYDFYGIFEHVPFSMHTWRQMDALSIASNYFYDGFKFFEPRMNFQISEGGRAVGEFPILYYINALIWKLTGPNYFTPRLLNVLISYAGLVALFQIGIQLFKGRFWAACIAPLVLFCSPIYVFYANNYIVNVPALSCLLMAWYYTLRYFDRPKTRTLLVAMLLFGLMAAFRTTMLLGFLPLLLVFYWSRIFNPNGFRYFTHPIEVALLHLPIIVSMGWMTYVKTYNLTYGSEYFLTTINPFWFYTKDTRTWLDIIEVRIPEFYQYGVWGLLVIGIGFMGWNRKKLIQSVQIGLLLLALGSFSYGFLWFNNLDDHDYYYLEFYLLTTSIVLTTVHLIGTHYPNISRSIYLKIGVGIVLLEMVLNCALVVRNRYHAIDQDWARVFLTKDQTEKTKYDTWQYDLYHRGLEGLEPDLRKWGIQRNDLVLSLPDISPNITLQEMNQKGFTSCYLWGLSAQEMVEECINRGAKFLIINDHNYLKDHDLSLYTHQKVGQYLNVSVYKLPKKKQP